MRHAMSFFFRALSFVSAAILFGVLTRWVYPLVSHATDVIPYTIQQRIEHFDSSGALRITEDVTVAVRSDGSRSQSITRHLLGTSKIVRARNVWDVINHKQLSIYDDIRSVVTVKLPTDTEATLIARSDTACTARLARTAAIDQRQLAPLFGQQVLAAVRYVGSSKQLNSQLVFAPKLNCVVLSEQVFKMPSAKMPSQALIQTTETVNLTTGEPASILFDVPSNYTERAPTGIMSEIDKNVGRQPCTTCAAEKALGGLADSRYHANHN